jgi:hypothetical protein
MREACLERSAGQYAREAADGRSSDKHKLSGMVVASSVLLVSKGQQRRFGHLFLLVMGSTVLYGCPNLFIASPGEVRLGFLRVSVEFYLFYISFKRFTLCTTLFFS